MTKRTRRSLQTPIWPVLMAIAAPLSALAQVQPVETAVTCTNDASGASWQIKIDYGRGTVDTNPARISDAEISWRDAKDRWNYTLDRKSGKLTAIIASSTGGYYINGTCALKSSG